MFSPGLTAPTAALIESTSTTSFPLTPTTTSPICTPARCAGLFASTLSTMAPTAFGKPFSRAICSVTGVILTPIIALPSRSNVAEESEICCWRRRRPAARHFCMWRHADIWCRPPRVSRFADASGLSHPKTPGKRLRFIRAFICGVVFDFDQFCRSAAAKRHFEFAAPPSKPAKPHFLSHAQNGKFRAWRVLHQWRLYSIIMPAPSASSGIGQRNVRIGERSRHYSTTFRRRRASTPPPRSPSFSSGDLFENVRANWPSPQPFLSLRRCATQMSSKSTRFSSPARARAEGDFALPQLHVSAR